MRSRSAPARRSSTRRCSSARCAPAWPWRRWRRARRRRSSRRCSTTPARATCFSTPPSAGAARRRGRSMPPPRRVALDASAAGRALDDWLAPAGRESARRSTIEPAVAVQHHLFVGHDRHAQGHRAAARDALGATCSARRAFGYAPAGVTLLATPLYSNTTLVVFFPTLAAGGSVVLMAKFDCAAYLRAGRAPSRDAHDARAGAVPAPDGSCPTSTRTTCRRSGSSSAPARRSTPSSRPRCCGAGRAGWSSIYGMTEGGGTCILAAHLHPRQAAHRRPAGRGPRHPADRRAGARGAARRGGRSRRPLRRR